MKRIRRDPGKFEVLNLFACLGRREGLVLGDKQSEKNFLNSISASLLRNKDNQALLHGLQTEDIFQHVAASLGKCLLIKKEDTGEPLANTENIQPPDYLFVMSDKSRFLIEVKNCNKKSPPCVFSLKEAYVDKLLRYTDLVDNELKIAIYWSAWNLWTLIRPSQFECSNGKYSITMPKAMQINEMNILGDFSVGTTPPLVFRIVADKNNPRSVGADSLVNFTIGRIELLCGDTEIKDKSEQQYAFYFMLYCNWQSSEPKATIEDNRLVSIDYVIESHERTQGQNFEFLGFMSSMISRQYREVLGVSSGDRAMTIATEPGLLGLTIPKDYKGKALPLWRFHVKPKLSGGKTETG
jgi:hypothetical protein